MSENEPKASEVLDLEEMDAVSGGNKNGRVMADGTVTEVLPNACFNVQLDDGRVILCPISGRLRMNYVRLLQGDRVQVEINSPNDSHGRIVYRYK